MKYFGVCHFNILGRIQKRDYFGFVRPEILKISSSYQVYEIYRIFFMGSIDQILNFNSRKNVTAISAFILLEIRLLLE